MEISDNIIRHYLKNCYFINGTAYAGKSTMCTMLAERYGMLHCGENYNMDTNLSIATVEDQPNTCYFRTMSGWQEFLNRTPEQYAAWVEGNGRELSQFEVTALIRLSADTGRKIIVDTNIPCNVLHRISDYHHVAIMLSPMSMSVERFFDRSDPEKQFLLSEIEKAENPQKTMENFRACIARVNSQEVHDSFRSSGFYTIEREDNGQDTREETLQKLAAHFGLE
ncbi:MAG: hypothetical protein IJ493_11340 [Clostridia bacterium]|nr:hypothetical protein [Clostridia bacterium]